MSNEYLGRDLNIDFSTATTGDVDLVQGRKCLIQDICNLLCTPKGDLWCHPDYGVDIYNFVHIENTALNRLDLIQTIEEAVRDDPRIDTVQAEILSWDNCKVTVQVSVTPVAETNGINLVLGYDLTTITAEVISGGY
jgi:phage baseplate assembly protein W